MNSFTLDILGFWYIAWYSITFCEINEYTIEIDINKEGRKHGMDKIS